MSEAIVYFRESPSAPSLFEQAKKCEIWAKEHKMDVVDVVTEFYEANQPLRFRARLLRLLLDFKRGQTLLLYSRETLELAELSLGLLELEIAEKRGVIRSVMEPDLTCLLCPTRREEITMIVNHYRHQLLGGKIKTTLQERLALGLRAGNIKLGEQADEDGFLSENPEELEALGLVKSFRSQGMSPHEIQEELEALEIKCRSGRTPSIPTISRWTYYERGILPVTKAKVKLEEKMPHLAEEILRLRKEGRTFKQICNDLAALGYYSRTGKPFMPTQIRRVYGRVS